MRSSQPFPNFDPNYNPHLCAEEFMRKQIENDPELRAKFIKELRDSIFSDEELKKQILAEYREFLIKVFGPKITHEVTKNSIPPFSKPKETDDFIPLPEINYPDDYFFEDRKPIETKIKPIETKIKPTESKKKSDTKPASNRPLMKPEPKKRERDNNNNNNNKTRKSNRYSNFCGDKNCTCYYESKSNNPKVSFTKLVVTNLPNIDKMAIREDLGDICKKCDVFPFKTFVGYDGIGLYSLLEFQNHSAATRAFNYLKIGYYSNRRLSVNFFIEE